nr:BF3164 family lipoprotein [Odoribacter splanchnicus]
MHPIEGQTIFGFGDLYAAKHYIYTIYRGIVYGSSDRASHIAVFDWKGNCAKLYKAEYQLYNLCVDEEVHKIYVVGVERNLETVVAEFKMDNVSNSLGAMSLLRSAN